MNEQIFSGPPLPRRVRTAFAYLEYVQSRLQPCCHPAGELSKQEAAVEAAALRTLVQFMTGEHEFVDPMPPPAPAASGVSNAEEQAPREATAS
ncbi:MAG: hypothetical protein JNL80_17510 [Phycisphaerae bacterium]|jgi:hypothetical protein|nr:hypothetical protein [Phycisphaerae bacterium]